MKENQEKVAVLKSWNETEALEAKKNVMKGTHL